MENNNMGITYHDSDKKKSLAEKMVLAIAAYERRLGTTPTFVELHPDDYPDIPDGSVVNGLTVSRSPKTPVAHYFLSGELVRPPLRLPHREPSSL